MDEFLISPDELNEGIAVFRYDAGEGHVEYANKALIDLLGFPPEKIRGANLKTIFSAVDPRDIDKVKWVIDSLPQKKMATCTYRFKDSSGRTKWLTSRCRYLEDEKGARANFVYQDITEHMDTIARERIMVQCLRMITSDNGRWEENITKALADVQLQYQADRCYIFEFDWSVNRMSNVFETVGEGVSPEIDSLKDLPVDIVSYWLPRFRNGDSVFIDNLEAIKEDPARKEEYEVLAPQDIVSLMVVPITRGDHLYGYIGVDNPGTHQGDKDFLTSIAHILSQEYRNRDQQEKLRILSLTDPLTRINNRHAFNRKLEKLDVAGLGGVGVVFADVNGLKYVNDTYGHSEGDALIRRAVAVLLEYFDDTQVFRISGDEFVCLVEDSDEEAFSTNVERMRMDVSTNYGAIFSVGHLWDKTDNSEQVEQMIGDAEKLMYEEKERFHRDFPDKSSSRR